MERHEIEFEDKDIRDTNADIMILRVNYEIGNESIGDDYTDCISNAFSKPKMENEKNIKKIRNSLGGLKPGTVSELIRVPECRFGGCYEKYEKSLKRTKYVAFVTTVPYEKISSVTPYSTLENVLEEVFNKIAASQGVLKEIREENRKNGINDSIRVVLARIGIDSGLYKYDIDAMINAAYSESALSKKDIKVVVCTKKIRGNKNSNMERLNSDLEYIRKNNGYTTKKRDLIGMFKETIRSIKNNPAIYTGYENARLTTRIDLWELLTDKKSKSPYNNSEIARRINMDISNYSKFHNFNSKKIGPLGRKNWLKFACLMEFTPEEINTCLSLVNKETLDHKKAEDIALMAFFELIKNKANDRIAYFNVLRDWLDKKNTKDFADR